MSEDTFGHIVVHIVARICDLYKFIYIIQGARQYNDIFTSQIYIVLRFGVYSYM